MTVQSGTNAVVLSWINPLFSLQAAPAVSGPYTNNPAAFSPYTNALNGPKQFFPAERQLRPDRSKPLGAGFAIVSGMEAILSVPSGKKSGILMGHFLNTPTYYSSSCQRDGWFRLQRQFCQPLVEIPPGKAPLEGLRNGFIMPFELGQPVSHRRE